VAARWPSSSAVQRTDPQFDASQLDKPPILYSQDPAFRETRHFFSSSLHRDSIHPNRKEGRPIEERRECIHEGQHAGVHFLKERTVAGAATMGAGLLAGNTFAFDREDEDGRASITKGDMRF